MICNKNTEKYSSVATMALEMQDLSGSSSDGDSQSEYDITGNASEYSVSDVEIAQALHGNEAAPAKITGPSRLWQAVRFIGIMVAVVGMIAAAGYIFYDGQIQHVEQERLSEELKMVEAFVQYEPETIVYVEELPEGTLKITDPPPK
jgi:hypothetical protein